MEAITELILRAVVVILPMISGVAPSIPVPSSHLSADQRVRRAAMGSDWPCRVMARVPGRVQSVSAAREDAASARRSR